MSLAQDGTLSNETGYFRFGTDVICYGRLSGPSRPSDLSHSLHDACFDVTIRDKTVVLPFDLTEVINNLRQERYVEFDNDQVSTLESPVNRFYYLVRPLLPVAVRKHLQRLRLYGWDQIPFPRWPVDRSVDNMFERLLLLSLRAGRRDKIPFIWFWPNGAPSCAIMTHDVETIQGRDFCGELMDIDDSFGLKSAFQLVPEQRYEITSAYLDSIRNRGFEVCVQDLNHDGSLYRNREQFIARAAKINEYGRQWGAEGFRAGILYRRQEWFDALDFAYDMSVPNVAHLDPQRGGCCTVMPYFVGKLLELPVTTTQDYSLFHILKDHSIDLWKRQIDLIMEKHGLISFIIHPDYIGLNRERRVYESLLAYLARLREEKKVWTATPSEANRWWRQRTNMHLVKSEGVWQIVGEGKDRARIAYACEENGQIKLSLQSESVVC